MNVAPPGSATFSFVSHEDIGFGIRHSFELTRIAGKPTAGVFKDVVMLGGSQELEFEFVAIIPE